jgi:glycosyltransferase involved in cell wall biosynthesis
MKFCFFGNISGALLGKTLGGAELQISLLARALSIEGHDIVIIDPYSTKGFVTDEGVKVITVPNWNKGPKGIRLFSSRIPELWKVLIEQNADYYYVRMRTYLHLIIYFASRKVGAKFIQAIAHDLDVASLRDKFRYEHKSRFNLFKFLTISLPNDLSLYFLLKNADYVILQHKGQQNGIVGKNTKVVIYPNIIDIDNMPSVNVPSMADYIHVGAISVLKGSKNLYDLIQILDSKCRIIIIGQPIDKPSLRIVESLHKYKNVVLKGRLDHKETMLLIANAKAIISTSNYEGFPNIFLEAWSAGVPVISLNVNPGEVIDKFHLGFYCDSSLQKMKEYMESNKLELINKDNLLSYISEFHSFHKAGIRFIKALTIK